MSASNKDNFSFVEKLQEEMKTLEAKYTNIVLWKNVAFDPDGYRGKIVYVDQNDFKYGTLRILAPCKIVLKESIAFNPNRPEIWVKDLNQRIETSDFSEAVSIHPDSVLDYYPNESVRPVDRPSNKDLYFMGDVKHAYRLGFFAAIAVEATGVIIDLDGYTLGQNKEHALMQRFFSLIELADQPFLMGQGPAQFGHVLRTANYVWIKNGTLGLSAHHHIHGNDPTNVLITDINFKDAEVASVSLNGAKNVVMMDCEVDRNRQSIAILGSFSAARFALKFTEAVVNAFMANPSYSTFLTQFRILEAYQNLKRATHHIFNDMIFGLDDGQNTKDKINLNPNIKNKAGQSGDPSHIVFHNPNSLMDGPTYGLLFNTKGVAINKFAETYDKVGMELANVALIRCSVASIKADILEIPVLTDAQGSANQVDVAGASIEFLGDYGEYGLRNADGTYRGTVLSELQFALQKVKNILPPVYAHMFNTLNIDPYILKWAEQSYLKDRIAKEVDKDHQKEFGFIEDRLDAQIRKNQWKLLPLSYENAMGLFEPDGKTPIFGDDNKPVVYKVRFQGDFMHHVLKGVIGIRLEGACTALLRDVKVTEVENIGGLGRFIKPYYGPPDGGHELQGKMVGYFGNHARGISISAACNIFLERVRVTNVKSSYGSASGLVIQNDTNVVTCKSIFINTVWAGKEYIAKGEVPLNQYPNTPPKACGLRIDQSCNDIHCEGVNVQSDVKQPLPEEANACQINSKRITISLG